VNETSNTPEFATRWPNLAQPRLGAVVTFATDDFFAAKERLIQAEEPVHYPGRFDDHGGWMDGWESRRKRVEGHDWCDIRLGGPALIYGVNIDTSYFTGNFPVAASLDARPDDKTWTEIVPVTTLSGNAQHFVPVATPGPWRELRLHIYPDGGVARLRVYGRYQLVSVESGLVELSGLMQGGRPVAWSDAHYGWPGKVFLPDHGVNMGDGWETRRRRVPGNEWQIVELGQPGVIRRIEIDTAHNKGNYPDRVSIQAAHVEQANDLSIATQSMFWKTLLPEQPLGPDQLHVFETQITDRFGPITHARINIIPDGGVSRIRLFGEAQQRG
jgi:allantoicase